MATPWILIVLGVVLLAVACWGASYPGQPSMAAPLVAAAVMISAGVALL